jgi:hypothetical protein
LIKTASPSRLSQGSEAWRTVPLGPKTLNLSTLNFPSVYRGESGNKLFPAGAANWTYLGNSILQKHRPNTLGHEQIKGMLEKQVIHERKLGHSCYFANEAKGKSS